MICSSNNIDCFELGLDIYNSIFRKSVRLIKKEKVNKETISTIEKLDRDIYLALFKAKPVLKEENLIDINYRFNNMIIKNILEIDEIEPLRKKCSVNYFNSILAAEILSD